MPRSFLWEFPAYLLSVVVIVIGVTVWGMTP